MANALSTRVCACGKDCYPSKRAAASASRAIVRHKGGRELRPYRCDSGAWHLTQQRVSKAARSAMLRESTQPNLPPNLPHIEYGPKDDKPRKVVPLPAKPVKPRFERGPAHTGCPECGYRWLFGDPYLNPEGRHCPTLGCNGHIVLGADARGREFRFEVAA